MWKTGIQFIVSRRWYKNGTEVTTGTATVEFRRSSAGVWQYLQADLSTWAVGSQTHALTFTAGNGWHMFLTVPASAKGFEITAHATHSDTELPPLPENHYVVTKDTDDINTELAGQDKHIETKLTRG